MRKDPVLGLMRFSVLGPLEVGYDGGQVAFGGVLGLWRGQALADLADTGITWPVLGALEEARLTTWEDCFEAELACGRHSEVISELSALVEAEPLRERLCGQLMLALYRAGR